MKALGGPLDFAHPAHHIVMPLGDTLVKINIFMAEFLRGLDK